MKTLTKDEVRKLTPEQQEAFGSMEVQRIRARGKLVARARGRRGRDAWAGLLMGVGGGLAMYSAASPRILPFAIIFVCGFAAFSIGSLNKRLDALMQLLDRGITGDVPIATVPARQAD